MRKIIRAAAKVLTVFLWIAKGLLLLLAVGAVVLWPVSRGRSMAVSAQRFTAGPASGESRWYYAQCLDGRTVLARGWVEAGGGLGLARIRAAVQYGGDGWRWERRSNAYHRDEGDWPSRWGPLRWGFTESNSRDGTYHYRDVGAPLWLVSLAAGAWPLASITLLIRRRRKQRRLARVGCCQSCGYDLRATTEKGGPLLARCPECGADAAGTQRPED